MAQSQQTPLGSNGVHNGQAEHGFDDDIAMLREDIAKLTESVSHMVKEQTNMAQDRLRDVANDAYSTLNEAGSIFSRAGSGLYDDAHARLDTLASELTETIKRAPLTSIGLAAAFGFLYGVIRR